jgi:hypothetical protein
MHCYHILTILISSVAFFMQAVTASSTKKADLIFGEIQSQIKNKNITVDVKANSESNVNLSLYMYILNPWKLHALLKMDLQHVHFL